MLLHASFWCHVRSLSVTRHTHRESERDIYLLVHGFNVTIEFSSQSAKFRSICQLTNKLIEFLLSTHGQMRLNNTNHISVCADGGVFHAFERVLWATTIGRTEETDLASID